MAVINQGSTLKVLAPSVSETVIMHDTFVDTITQSIGGRVPDTVQNSTYTWTSNTSTGREVQTDGTNNRAKLVWAGGSGIPDANYRIGAPAYTITGRSYLNVSNMVSIRLAASTGFGTWAGFTFFIRDSLGANNIEIREYLGSSSFTSRGTSSALGISRGTWIRWTLEDTGSNMTMTVHNDALTSDYGSVSYATTDRNTNEYMNFASGTNTSGNYFDEIKVVQG